MYWILELWQELQTSPIPVINTGMAYTVYTMHLKYFLLEF